MHNSTISAPSSAQAAVPANAGTTPPSQPTFIINNTKPVRSPRRYAYRHPSRIEIGGGVLPNLKCNRSDLGACLIAAGCLAALVFAAKYGFKKLFSPKEKPNTRWEQAWEAFENA